MTLVNLRSFISFDFDGFQKDKSLVFLSAKNKMENKGVKVVLLIMSDNTHYQNDKNNLGEQIAVTILNKTESDFSDFLPLKTFCKVINVTKSTVYGEFQNQLSLHADVTKIDNEVKR